MSSLQVVWFKRDLRVDDHRPLLEASELGAVLPLYVVEPELWQQPDASERQWLFCRESLLELRQTLALKRAIRREITKCKNIKKDSRQRTNKK